MVDTPFRQGSHAIFLDRDGVLNRERPDYVKSWAEFVWLPGALPAMVALSRLGLPLVLITNQSVIGRGITSAADVAVIHARMCAEIQAAGGRLDAIYCCPHHPDAGCSCRKPRPGLILSAAADLCLTLANCWFIGDSLTDRAAAMSVGCRSLLVCSGRQGALIAQQAQALSSEGTLVVPDLVAAAHHLSRDRFPSLDGLQV